MDPIRFEFENKQKIEFDSLLQAIFEIFHIGKKDARLERIPPTFHCLKYLQAIDPSFVTIKKLSICKGVKCMCKLFEINAQQDF